MISSSADRAFIRDFQPTVEIALEAGHRLLCSHGSPASFDDLLLPDISHTDFYVFLGAYDATVMAGGHATR